jgi:hypothetical protein
VNESVKVRVISKRKRVFTTRKIWGGGVDKAFVIFHVLVLTHLATQNACFDIAWSFVLYLKDTGQNSLLFAVQRTGK